MTRLIVLGGVALVAAVLFVAGLIDIRTALLKIDFLMDPLDTNHAEGANQ